MGTQNFYLNNLNKFKKINQKTHYINFAQQTVNNINTTKWKYGSDRQPTNQSSPF